MGRKLRPNSPGGIFHLTAYTLRGERLFTPRARTAALGIVASAISSSDVRLLAVAIMPNHLHLVVQQGDFPVSDLMHALVRRLAHLLQREHRRRGPIFWRPYSSTPCLDPNHARNAIVYTHLNPVRARLCADPLAYGWTSHRLFVRDTVPMPGDAGLAAISGVLALDVALRLFAVRPDRDTLRLGADYRAAVEWRLHADRRMTGAATPRGPVLERPMPIWGDLYWSHAMSPLFHPPNRRPGHGRPPLRNGPVPALRDIARAVLATDGRGLELADVRGRGGGRKRVELRRQMFRRMHAAGYQNVQIARFLGVSETTVSNVLVADRRA